MEESSLAKALGKIPSGIFVLTYRKDKEEAALLASWVQQASFEPPTISIAVHHDRPIRAHFVKGAKFVVNLLSEEEKSLYRHFVKGFAPGSKPFDGVRSQKVFGEAPVLSDALAALACEVSSLVPVGDHDLILARVLDGRLLRDGEPRIHVRKNGLSY